LRLRLKGSLIGRESDGLVIVSDLVERVVLEDASDDLVALVELLERGGWSRESLLAELAATRPDVQPGEVLDALDAFDELGLLADDDADDQLSDWQRERHSANLAFFGGFATSSCSAASYQQRLLDAHVVVLGLGGVGCSCVTSMSGLGVGRLTLVDYDEIELSNLSRQFIFRHADVGRPKVDRAAEWVRELDPTIDVRVVTQRIGGPEEVSPLVRDAGLMIMAIDHPLFEVDFWVNEACVAAGVPYVRGGANGREFLHWSVDPGRSACRACAEHDADTNPIVSPEVRRSADVASSAVNPAVGPVIGALGSLVALEAMRYLTGFAAPAAAGTFRRIDTCTGREDVHAWPRWPDCPVCALAPPAAPRTTTATAARVERAVHG
jgi:molybdopterin/thiamine biosynthesis adenylyltransferase